MNVKLCIFLVRNHGTLSKMYKVHLIISTNSDGKARISA